MISIDELRLLLTLNGYKRLPEYESYIFNSDNNCLIGLYLSLLIYKHTISRDDNDSSLHNKNLLAGHNNAIEWAIYHYACSHIHGRWTVAEHLLFVWRQEYNEALCRHDPI